MNINFNVVKELQPYQKMTSIYESKIRKKPSANLSLNHKQVNVVIPSASKDQFASIDSSRSKGKGKKKIGDMRGLMDIKKAEILDSIEDRYLIVPPA